MSVDHAIVYMVSLAVAFVAACVMEKTYRDKRSRRRALEDPRASDLRAIRSLRLGTRFLLALVVFSVAALVVLYLSILFEMDIWGYILGDEWIFPWT